MKRKNIPKAIAIDKELSKIDEISGEIKITYRAWNGMDGYYQPDLPFKDIHSEAVNLIRLRLKEKKEQLQQQLDNIS